MQAAYPELKESAERVSKVVLAEEEQFARVMDLGFRKLEEEIGALEVDNFLFALNEWAKVESVPTTYGTSPEQLITALREQPGSIPAGQLEQFLSDYPQRRKVYTLTLSGEKAFRLYETFGMPLDFMVDAARDAGIEFDYEGFERAKLEEQQRARASWKGGSQKSAAPVYRDLAKTEFQGYGATRLDGARVLALVKNGVGVASLQPGETGEVVLDATSFY